MQLNQATDYALRVVLHLAGRPFGECVNSNTIAMQQNIPPRFLQKIMRSLIKAGLIKSLRGVDGGFVLIRHPEAITLLDVITAMEGPIAIHQCLAERAACNKHCTPKCPVHAALDEIQDQFIAALQNVDFASLVAKCQNER